MPPQKNITIIGGGPSGLMAAEILAQAGYMVSLYDAMPSLGRKFLMAGRGGLNLTHSEGLDKFITRYGGASDWLAPVIRAFPPSALREWCEALGEETFVGSSGRVFPRSMKAAPLLRAWLARLNKLGVRYFPRHYWHGWEGDLLAFRDGKQEKLLVKADATLLALGGASWPRLGSDGGWVDILREIGVEISPLRAANCGFVTHWSDYFAQNFAGTPLKSVLLRHENISQMGEIMLTKQGVEGGAVYALSGILRESIAAKGHAWLEIDLRPSMLVDELASKLGNNRGNQSLSTYLRKANFPAFAVALLREVCSLEELQNASVLKLAQILKNIPLKLTVTTGLQRAISTAGGIKHNAINPQFMLHAKPSVFVAGEMLDWEAPTGGYLLQACFSTAVAAAQGMMEA